MSRRNLPSPGAVIAVVALVVAMAGAAYAGTKSPLKIRNNSVSTKKIRNAAVTTDKLADNAVTAAKIADSAVGTTEIADNAVTPPKIPNDSINGDKINESTLGTVSTAESNVAFAYVDPNGAVNPDVSKNITSANVTRPNTGIYCFDLPFAIRGGQATGEADATPDDFATIQVSGVQDPPLGCPAGTEASVRNWSDDAGLANDAFYVEFYR